MLSQQTTLDRLCFINREAICDIDVSRLAFTKETLVSNKNLIELKYVVELSSTQTPLFMFMDFSDENSGIIRELDFRTA